MGKKEEEIIKLIKVAIVSPKATIFEGEADFLHVPGKSGILGILPDHTKMVAALRKGVIVIENKAHGKKKTEIAIEKGIMQVNRGTVEMIVDVAETVAV